MSRGDDPSVQQALWDGGLDEDVSVEIQTVVSDSVQRMQDVQSTLQAGRAPPDIHMMDSGWTIPFILREQTITLTGQLPDDVSPASKTVPVTVPRDGAPPGDG